MYKPLRVMCAVNIESKICHRAPLICIAMRTEGERRVNLSTVCGSCYYDDYDCPLSISANENSVCRVCARAPLLPGPMATTNDNVS